MAQYHYTYLVTSLEPNSYAKYYIGVRSTNHLPENDPYMGSSAILRNDIAEFGLRAFEKLIIEIYPTRQQAGTAESKLIKEHNASKSKLFYNQTLGQTPKINVLEPVEVQFSEPEVIDSITGRPMCECGKAYKPINYKKNGKTYYRKLCKICAAKKKPRQQPWEAAGYVKKKVCERCGFKAKHEEQIHVTQTIGPAPRFKSICLNCEVAIQKSGGWKTGDLEADA